MPALLAALRDAVPAAAVRERLDTLAAVQSDRDAVRRLGNGIEALQAVPAALYCFLSRRESFPEAVRAAVLLGGDTDTIAAMTGALAGASLGRRAIPERGWTGWSSATA